MAFILILASIVMIIFLITYVKLHPFLTLLLVSIAFGLVAGMDPKVIIQSVKDGFGMTLGSVGLIIIVGIMIGTFLENSGGAMTLATKTLNLIGQKRINTTLGIIGYIISVPVFADSGFILLSSLAKSLSRKAGVSLSGPAMALSLGLTVTHNLVPPTPGPIAAAEALKADLGLVIMLGVPIAIIALIVGLIYAKRYASKMYIDPNFGLEEDNALDLTPESDRPGFLKSSLPIILPLILIISLSIVKFNFPEFFPKDNIPVDQPIGIRIISFLGEPLVALLIGLGLCLLLPKKLNNTMWSEKGWIGKALKDCTSVLLITGAGGIFGLMLRNSNLAGELGSTLSSFNLGIWLPFVLAATFKSSQGSSTVALNTTAFIMSSLMVSLGFTTELDKALVVVAIGAGSMVVSHTNDSFFWVVTQMSGMDVKTGYKLQTLGTLIIGLTAGVTVFILHLFFAS